MSKPQALIEQVRSSVAVELERRHAPTLLADRKAAKAAKHKAKHHKYTKAAFFRYCYYDPAFKFFCEQVLDVDYLSLPEATRAASEVGVQNSSDYVCTPEIDCIPVLQKVSEDYSVPVLYLTYDSQTSDTGLDTRLEAFYDMLSMKKEKSK